MKFCGPRITRREREVLGWIAAGKSDWEIGRILNISAKTVNYHVEKAKRKFGVATRIQAVVLAMRKGLLPPTSRRPYHRDFVTAPG